MLASALSLLLPGIGGLLLVLGALLIKRGLWPRRVGLTPHCPKCDYILSGEPERCSECGTTVSARNVVRGERQRRAAPTWFGGALAVMALLVVFLWASDTASKIQWIHYEPLSWLLRDLGSGNASLNVPAWVELQRRIGENRLSDAEQSELVDKGLQVRTLGTTWPHRNAILDYIAGRYTDKKLTDAQADQFFAGMLKVSLSVRPTVGAQSRVPYLIRGTGDGPNGWWLRMRTLEVQLDDRKAQRGGGGSGGSSFGGWSTGSTLDPVGAPGKHHLRVKVELATDIDRGGGVNWDDDASVAKRLTQDLTADFQVIPGQTPIETVTSPDASALRPLLKPRLEFNPGIRNNLSVMVDGAALPVDVAFDVLIRFDGKEYPASSVHFLAGSPGGYGTSADHFPTNAPVKVDVIFRSSERVARETVDMSRIWKGEITVPDVALPRPPGSHPSSAPPTKQAGFN